MEREYVGIDFHRRRSVVVRVSAAGERLSVVRVDNDPVAIAAAVGEAGPSPEVVITCVTPRAISCSQLLTSGRATVPGWF